MIYDFTWDAMQDLGVWVRLGEEEYLVEAMVREDDEEPTGTYVLASDIRLGPGDALWLDTDLGEGWLGPRRRVNQARQLARLARIERDGEQFAVNEQQERILEARNRPYRTLADAARATGDLRFIGDQTKVWYRFFAGKPEMANASYVRMVDLGMGAEWARERGGLPTLATLEETHRLVGTLAETDLEKVWILMQGFSWSPAGQANGLITRLGLRHTSMSVGDVLEIDGRLYFADRVGFVELD